MSKLILITMKLRKLNYDLFDNLMIVILFKLLAYHNFDSLA